jgi:hypothetical protein
LRFLVQEIDLRLRLGQVFVELVIALDSLLYARRRTA